MPISFEAIHPIILLTLLIYGEARGEDLTGKAAVAWVAVNRSLKWNMSLKDVILQPRQFSCFNPDDPNSSKLGEIAVNFGLRVMHDQLLKECFAVAVMVYLGLLRDPTHGALYYHNQKVKPRWAADYKVVAHIGNHVFYTG